MRKKFTMLLVLLLACMGVVKAEGLKVNQRYRLKNVASGLYMQNMGLNNNLQLQQSQNGHAQHFCLEDAGDGKYFLKSMRIDAKKYVNASGWDSKVNNDENATPYTIALVDGTTDVYTLDQAVSTYKGMIGANSGDTSVGTPLYCNKSGANAQWQFEVVESPVECTFNPEKTYRIKSEYCGLYMELVNPTQTSGEGAFQFKNKSTNAGQKFKFEAAEDGKYYMKTIDGDNTFYVNASSWNFYAGAEPTTPFEIAIVGDETAIYSLNQQVADYKGYAGNVNDANDGTYIYNNQGSLNKNTVWSFEEVADVVVEVTYIYKYGETELKRETVPSVVGASYAFNLPFGFATETTGTVTTETGEVNVVCTVNLPFEYAASVEEITKWYYVQMKSTDKKFIQSVVTESENYIEWTDASRTEGEVESYLWAFVGNITDGFKMVNNTGVAIKSTGSGNPVLASLEEATAWVPAQSKAAGSQYFCFQYPGSNNYMNAQDGKIAHWGDNDQGSTFNVVEAETYTINYTYTYELNEETHEIGTSSATVCVGCPYPAVNMPFGYVAETPVGKVFADDARTIVCTDNLPFAYAANAESIECWYYMQMHSNNKKYVKGVENALEWKDATVDEENKGAYAWGFVGDPINGFKVVNYAKGVGFALSSTGNNDDAVTFAEFANATVLFTQHTTENKDHTTHFCLKPAEGHYLNAQGETVKHWGNTDAGSTIVLTEVVMTFDRELELLVAQYESIAAGVNPGEYTVVSVNSLKEAIATAKTVKNATEADITALEEAYNALATNPVVAGLYRIVSANANFTEAKGITCYAKDEFYGHHHYSAWAPVNENDPLQYWILEANGDGIFNIKAAYEGNYITSATSMSETAKAATFTELGDAQFNITLAGDENPLHCNGWNWEGTSQCGLTTWNGGKDTPSAWKLIAVTEAPEFTYELTVGETGYASLMLAFNAAIPGGVTCYTVKADDAVAKLTEIEAQVLPANTPVIVNAVPNNIYSFKSVSEDVDAIDVENELAGTLYPKCVAANAYVLANTDNEGIGFYKALLNKNENGDNGDTHFLNNANKAYLVVEGANAPMFSLNRGEGTTSIDELSTVNGQQTTVIYDLTGRRVEKMEKGIYIVNGRKVIVK